MKILIALIAALSLLSAIFVFIFAKSAVHEILSAILILCFVAAAVGLSVLDRLDKIIAGQTPPSHPIATKIAADEAWKKAQLG
jgi:hypothetical protein